MNRKEKDMKKEAIKIMKQLGYSILGLSLLLTGCKQKTKTAPTAAQQVPKVLVAHPQQDQVIYSYQYPAYLEAIQTVNLVARVSGFLEKMNYSPGEPVKKGQLLFVIEPQPYQDQLKAAEAQLQSMQARLVYAQAQYEKMKEAMPSKAISEIDFIQSESDYRTATANLQDAKAQLNTARTNLNYSYIRAPFDGRVSRNMVDVQNYVNGSVQPVTLATMYRDQLLYAYFNMAYQEFQNLPDLNSLPDSTLNLTFTDATNPQRVWKGRLDYTSPNVDLQTGTVTVRAIAENPSGDLLSGMYVQVNIPYKKVRNAILIPESSIGTGQAGRYVYLVNEDNKIVQQIVKTGTLTPDNMREITEGVNLEDEYVVDAMMTVRPGMTIDPVIAKPRSK